MHGVHVSHAIGFRVKSGWAAAVLLAGPAEKPQALDRRRVDLCDPNDPDSTQPYHSARGMLEENDTKIQRRLKVVRGESRRSITALLDDYRARGYLVGGAGLVVGSLIDPSTIPNPHIRAHALEGQLFRTVLEEALQAQGVKSLVVLEREAYAKAAAVLDRSAANLKGAVSALGRSLPGPWRAEEKLAALVAWMALA
jgi:ABC-type phosphate transport system auxiliary subunit